MSRLAIMALTGVLSFPRVSGDEPTLLVKLPLKTEFSPRERG